MLYIILYTFFFYTEDGGMDKGRRQISEVRVFPDG